MSMQQPLEWGERVRRMRAGRGWTQVEFAERAGCSQTHVSQVETSVVRPDLDMQVRMATALDATVTELFPRTEGEAELALLGARYADVRDLPPHRNHGEGHS